MKFHFSFTQDFTHYRAVSSNITKIVIDQTNSLLFKSLLSLNALAIFEYQFMSFCFVHKTIRYFSWLLHGVYRTAATSKIEGFVMIVNSFQPLTIIRKCLDAAAALDPFLSMAKITFVFSFSNIEKLRSGSEMSFASKPTKITFSNLKT